MDLHWSIEVIRFDCCGLPAVRPSCRAVVHLMGGGCAICMQAQIHYVNATFESYRDAWQTALRATAGGRCRENLNQVSLLAQDVLS
ncbi:MAG: hypothetical protein CMJ74_12035 [Planctomycetaceae bacterium]|nr:hypothetical protein [Planctomycetaceae bacterium]